MIKIDKVFIEDGCFCIAMEEHVQNYFIYSRKQVEVPLIENCNMETMREFIHEINTALSYSSHE